MNNILNASGNKMATIGQDGIVYNTMGVSLGRVQDNGDVYDNMGNKVGSYDGKGGMYMKQEGALEQCIVMAGFMTTRMIW